MTTTDSKLVVRGGTPSLRFSHRELATLLVLCGALFLDALDVSMIGVALPSIQADLGMSTSALQWIVSAYTLGYAGFLLLGGQAADTYGRRRMFLASLTVFTVASGLGAMATSPALLITSRLITGISAAFTAPAALSIITTAFAGPRRTRALVIFGATGASGFALGLVAGGVLTAIHWRLVFLVPVLVGAAVLIGASLVLDPSGPGGRRRSLSVPSAVMATAAMVTLVYTVVQASADGWASGVTATRFGVGVVLGASFVVVSGRARHPLLRFGMLREPGVAAANIGGLALLGSWVSTLFVLTLYLQDVRGFSPLATGLAVCPCGLIVVVLAPRLAPPLVTRFGPINVAAAGLASAAVAYGLLQRITADSSYVTVVLPSLAFVGLAFTLGYGPLSIAGTNLPEHEQGVAAGVINTSFQIGPTLMIAVVTALVDSRLDRGASTDQLIRAYRVGLIAPLLAAAAGATTLVVSALRHPPQHNPHSEQGDQHGPQSRRPHRGRHRR